ncbi:MAG TPA: hypothetical protein VMW25_06280 [Clostridia bacterium]|nr:hypothetical protein [Clostridia bacterium]
MNKEEKNQEHSGFWLGMVLGGLLGAAGAFYAATEDKEELREKLVERAKWFLDNLDELKDRVGETGEELREKAIELPEMIEEKSENIEEIAKEAIEKITSATQKAQKKGIKTFFSKGKPLK